MYSIKSEIKGLLLSCLTVFLGGSLLSYHPQDPLFWNVTVFSWKAGNLFGTAGAHLAGFCLTLMGFGALWLVLLLGVLSILAFKRRPMPPGLKTAAAMLALLVSTAVLMHLHLPGGVLIRGGTLMSGGLVGMMAARMSIRLFNPTGAYILGLTVFVVAFMISTRLSLGWLWDTLWSFVMRGVRRVSEGILKRRERRVRIRKTKTAHERFKSRRKVTIVEPPRRPEKAPEQEVFAFVKESGGFALPPLDLLNDPPERQDARVQKESLEMNARMLEKKLGDFGVEGEVVEILPGPVITLYEYKPAPGVKISKVAGLSDDLALALRAVSIRIVAPIPGKAAIGIEIPNHQRELVCLKEILWSETFKQTTFKLPIALGKDITGEPVIADLAKMPHLLVAGATGTGKSVSINTIVNSLLFKMLPETVRFLMIDPKRIELSVYQDIPQLLHPVVTQPKEATKALRWAVREMERRYMLLSDRGVRNIQTYNAKVLKEKVSPTEGEGAGEGASQVLPYIILVIDELADLMMVSSKEVEDAIARLAQMSRAAGIHLIIATQRPSVDVLTGVIKANFPARISFQVSSKVDSRTILDRMGAETLLGDGDMLFLPPGVGRLTRIHGAYVSEEEVQRVTEFLRGQRKPQYDESVLAEVAQDEEQAEEGAELDEKYDEAVALVLQTGQASISMVQRRLRVGYNRAARMIEAMERQGIVGPSDGVRPREVYGSR